MLYSINLYYFRDKSGKRHSVWKSDFDADPQGFAKAYPDARMEVINRKTGDRGYVAVGDVAAAGKEGFNLFTVRDYQEEHYNKPSSKIQQIAQKVGADYLSRPKNQMGKAPSVAPKNASPFVKSLYETDNAMKGADYPIDYTSPKAVQQVNQRNQQVKTDASRTAAKQNEWTRQNQPMVNNGTVGVMKTQGQFEKDIDDSAKALVGSNFDADIDNAIDAAFKNAHKEGIKNIQSEMYPRGTAGMDSWISQKKYNQANDPEKILGDLTNNLKAGIDNMLSNPQTKQRILSEANRLGIDPESYIRNSVAPSIIERASERFDKSMLKRMLPNGSLDYIVGGIGDSMVGTLLGDLTTTRGQREYRQRALQATRDGQNPNFKPTVWDEAGRGAVSFLTDAPAFGAAGKGAAFATNKVFGNAAQQAITAANQSAFARFGTGIVKGILHGGMTGFQYGAMNGAVQNFSTGEDTSFGATFKAALLGGASEAASFAAMEGMGGAVGALGHKIGFNGGEKSFWQGAKAAGKKISFEAVKTGFEGLGMATGGVVSGKVRSALTGEDSEGFTVEGTLESCASAAIFKLMHAKDVFGKEYGRDGKKLGFKDSVIQKTARFFASDALKSSPNVFSTEETAQLMNAGSSVGMAPLKNIIDLAKRSKKVNPNDAERGEDGSDVLNYYQQIMQDPTVSWDAKAKFTTLVMGTMPESRPMMGYLTMSKEKIGGNEAGYRRYVNEYSDKGELLSKQEYDSIEKRNRIVYLRNMVRENQRFLNSLGVLNAIDKGDYNLQNEFFKLKAKNMEEVQDILDGMNTQGSKIDYEYSRFVLEHGNVMKTIESVASRYGMTKDELIKAAFDKNTMRRTDNEQQAIVQLRKECERIAFPKNKAHAEQSQIEGKDVAEENGLGTENPNQEAVTNELRNLSTAEDALQEMMDSNDIFKETYEGLKKQGLTNPQIYDAMIQQNGLTEEQLEPFARYINANARVQGMQQATQEAIEQRVESVAGDWAFHGTMDGKKADGVQMLYVKDSNGRTLIVGSGDVAYDPTTGRPKEDVGDMLVCLDVQTRQSVYVKVEDTTLDQMQDVESFKNEERQRLQNINAAPYNQAAQEQAMKDAAKPQPNGVDDSVKKLSEVNTKYLNEEKAQLEDEEMKLQGQISMYGEDADSKKRLEEIKKRKKIIDEELSNYSRYLDPPKQEQSVTEDSQPEKPQSKEEVEVLREYDTKRGKHVVVNKIRKETDGQIITKIEAKADDGTGVSSVHEYFPFPEEYEILPKYKEIIEEGEETILGVNELRENTKGSILEGTASSDAGATIVVKNEEGNVGTMEVALAKKNKSTEQEKPSRKFSDGTDVPMVKDSKGRPTPDYANMKPEQAAEILSADFGESAEKVADGQIKKAEKAVKDAEKMKVNYEGELNDILEQEELKKKTVAEAQKQLEHAQAIKKAMTAKKVAETVGKEEKPTEGANQAGSVASQKFQGASRLVGNKRSRTLPNNEKIKGHYEIVPAESLTPSHDSMNGYKKSDGFPVDKNGNTINDRDYENDKAAQQSTDQIALKYNGQAIEQVPVVSDEGIVYDGNGRTMAGQKAAKDGTDGEYIGELLENAENFGFTREQIEKSGIEHPRLVLVTDERMPYTTETFAKFNRNEKKAQNNTEQAVAKSKTLSPEDVGAIVSEIEGNGSLEAFFNNPNAISSLWKTLQEKGIIGQNEVAGLQDMPGVPNAQGKEFIKNLVLGAMFKSETIRMMGIDGTIKNKVINGIRAIMDNSKLGDYALSDEIEGAIRLLYEARTNRMKVDDLLRSSDFVQGNARDRFSEISQALAQALEGKISIFRDLIAEYNDVAKANNSGEANLSFYEHLDKDELIKEFVRTNETIKQNNIKLYGEETRHESSDVPSGNEEHSEETGRGTGKEQAEAAVKSLVSEQVDMAKKIISENPEKPITHLQRQMKIGYEAATELAKALGWQDPNEKIKILPNEDNTPVNPSNPLQALAKAADDFKKEHPMTDKEIMEVDGLDDEAKYTAIDYLNGEDDSEIARICYEQAYNKRGAKRTTEADKDTTNPLKAMKDAAADYKNGKKQSEVAEVSKPKTIAEKKAAAKKLKKENDKKTQDLMNQFLAAKDEKKNGSGKALSTLLPIPSKALKWMDRNLTLTDKQKELLPQLLSAIKGSMYARIKEGIYNLEDVIENVRKDFKNFFDALDKDDANKILAEAAYKGRFTDPETGERIKLSDAAERERKQSPEHQDKLVGDSKSAEERKQKENSFISNLKMVMGSRKVNGIRELRQLAKELGLEGVKDTDLQELAETAVVSRARDIASSKAMSPERKFAEIRKLYENQPSLNQRDSDRVEKQQYSTPAPYAYLADMYVKGNGKEVKSALEPSAGNGMLTIGLPMDKVHVNDIDEARLLNLHRQGFKNITSQDGTQPFADKDVDVVVTNPPFGTATPKEYDGYKISSLEGQMAINALESMKDDGRAAIIIGGKTEYAKNGSLNPKDKAFLGYLYSHYNVEDVINVDGSLYAKQGTTYPTRIILINGRRAYDPENKVYPPIQKEARAEAVKDYDELYKRINDDILRDRQQSAGVLNEQGGEGGRVRTDSDVREPNEKVLRGAEREGREGGTTSNSGDIRGNKRPTETSVPELGSNKNSNGEGTSPISGGTSIRDRGRDLSTEPDNGGKDGTSGAKPMGEGNRGGRPNSAGVSGRGDNTVGVSEQSPARGVGLKETPKRGLDTEKVKYVSQSSNPFSLNSVIPADQAKVTKKALDKIGDVDEFLVNELGYNDKDDMYHALGSEQADSVALAIHQAKQGNAFIIGDMTGIGKGRQAAAMIRYAYKSGKVPVFITAKKTLFSDMYRDLKSIGNAELRPFIWSAKDDENSADMVDLDGNLVYKRTSDTEQKKVMAYLKKYGKLPDGYDYIVTTYDSFNSGTMDYENGKKTVRKDGKGSKNGQAKRDLLEAIAKNANVIMDESHKAGGNGGGSAYLQYIVPKLNAVTFLSATYAKRPENMPIYALRTSMNQAGVEPAELIDAIKRGGTTLQEIMSQSLAASGQFIRRERDMTGVTIDWKAIEDPVVVQEQREQYDKIIGLFNDIIDFQRTYVNSYIDQRNEDISKTQGSIKNKQGTADLGIKNTPFASRTYNMVQQVLLSLKAREAAKSAIEHLKNGEKVVIALNNTNESQTGEYAEGVEMEAPDLGVVLKKGLNGVLRYEQSDDMDNKTYGYFDVNELGPEAAARYREIEDNINNASTGLSLSPIDVIRDELEDAGYKVGELTGRTYQLARNPNGTVSKVKRTNTDKKKLALDFNTDKLDVLILNRSASTGISLHDSKDFNVKEHKPRTMIVVQQQSDVNEEVQMRGRIDRTGQVNRGRYEYIVSQIPSEQRLLMMFKSKLRSLDANTTSSQKSKFNDMEVNDIINKYGDKVVKEYMADHLDLYAKMADPFEWEKNFGADLSTIDTQRLINTSGGKLGGKEAGADASKLLGRMALLKVAEQEKMLKEISELYTNEINRLNEMGENDLEITELPLKAKTIGKEVWKEGSEPNGDNAFADNTYIEKVNMAILKKPMKAEEVKKAQEGLTGGRSWDEYKEEKKTALKEYFVKKFNDEKVRLDERAKKIAQKAADKYNKEAKKNQDKNQLTDEQIEKNTQFQYDNIYKEEKAKADTALKNIKTKYQAFDRVLETFNTNEAYVLPTDINNPYEMSAFGNSYGRLIDIKITDNYSPTASTISFATLDGRRKITFPIHGLVGSGDKKFDVISTIYNFTRQADSLGDNNYRVVNKSIDNWDRMISNESRKDGYIITGNLMQALIDTKAQGLGGQLVKYTTDSGEVKTGILMPDRFKPTDAATEKVISSKADDFMSGKTTDIMSSDGDVRLISVSNWKGTTIELRVPKSKAKGGKYYLDEKLRSLADGNDFYTKGGSMVANLQPENVRGALDRLSSLGVKVREERKEGTHFRTERENSGNGTVVSDHVSKIADKVGGNVNMVNSPEEVTNHAVKERLDKGENVTGWYDEKTGEIHLYMPNIHDRYTAEKTIWHEVVGHKGMRGLFGDKFNDFLRSIYYDLDKPENAELKKLVDEERKYNPLNIYGSIEEGIARLAEDGKGEVGFWNTIKNKVTDLLHEIGYRIAPNTKDVKYLLWLSKNLQKNPNSPYWKLKANAVRERLNREKPSITDSEGMFFGDGKARDLESMPKKEYQEATDGQIHFRTTPSAATAIDRYHRALNAHGYMFTESYMDNMLALKNLMQAIRPDNKKIEDINSSENPYILQNTLQGAMSNEADMFKRNIMEPLSKAMAGVLDAFEGAKDEDKIKNFNFYMIKKHGLERNRVFYVRDHIDSLKKDEATKQDATNLQNDWNTLKKDLGDQLRRNAIRLDEYYSKMDEWIRDNIDKDFVAGDNDYSGFHGIYELDKADAYDDAAVIAEVMDTEANMESVKNGSVADFWNKINIATQYSLDSDYKNGLVTKDNHDNVSAMFDWYVPLRKFDETTAEDVYGYITEKGDPSSFIGSALMKAKGRKSLSETNILAQIGAIGNLSISRGGKNAIKQAFARFIRNNGGQGLVTEVNTWVELDGYDANNKPIWKEASPQIPEDATPDEVAKIVSDFENDMQSKKAKGEALNITNRGRIGFKFERAKDKSQHIVDVMIAGKKHSFVINGNPRAAQAINGLLENSKATGFRKVYSSISRFMAQTCTSYNPEFVVRNIVRDFEFALANVSAKEDARYRHLFEKYYAGLIPIGGAKSISIKDLSGSNGFGLFAKYRNGTLDMSNKVERYFKEFMENGGETGWAQIKNMKDWEKQYKSDIKTERSGACKTGKMLKDFFFGNLANINEVAENQARFAVFCASRDYGRSAVRSAYDAKEVSTNFNRHGSGDAINSFKNGELGTMKDFEKKTIGFTSSYLRHCSMFFNAGIQSTNLLLKNFKTAKLGTVGFMAAEPFALGALSVLLNNCLIASEDEKDRKGVKDPYGELPDYIRRNNLCIYKGNGEFVTIPLAIELRAFYGLGDMAAGLTFSPNVSGQKNAALDAVGCVSQLVPVFDYLGNSSAGKAPATEFFKAIAPSALSPLIEWGSNSDWKGSPIERRGDFYDNSPAWERAYSGTPEFLKGINKYANAQTNDVAKGNEKMLGNKFLDAITNPSGINHFFGGIGGGAETFTLRSIGLAKNAIKGEEVETKDIPFVRSFFYTPTEQSSMQRTKSKWYNYVDDMKTTIENVKTLKSKNASPLERLKNAADYLKFQNSSDAEKVRIIEQAQKQMKKWQNMKKKSDDNESIKFAEQNIDLIMQKTVDELDKLN